MPTLVIPNTFSPNTTAVSADVNANFNAIATLLNSTKLDSTNLQPKAVGTSLIADAAVGTTQIAANAVNLALLAAEVSSKLIPTGAVVPYAGTFAPTGWLMCDGASYSTTTYSNLYSIIGHIHGGAGSVFNVPDYRGRFIRGSDHMGTAAGAAGRDPDSGSRSAMNTGGNTSGVGSVQTDQVTTHNHTLHETPHTHTATSTIHPTSAASVSFGPNFAAVGNSDGGAPINSATTGITIDAFGGNETRPKNAYANYIIKI